MADNTLLNSGTGGDRIVTLEGSFSGDTAKLQGVGLFGASGSEGAYTFGLVGGDASNGLDVDVTRSALPTGASTSANQTTIIGHLDGVESLLTTIDADTGAVAAAVKTEDAAHASGDTGVMALAVRQDANTSLVSADGDYAPLQVDSTGSLKVAIVSGAGSGGTSAADGATFTRNTTSLTPVGAAVESSAPTLTNGDVAALSQDTSGNLRVRVAAGGIAGVTEDTASADGAEGVLAMAVRQDTLASNTSADGDYTWLKTTSAGRLYTSTAIDTALPAGTNNIGDVDVLTLPGAAHDAAISGNPVRIAGRALTSDYTAVAAGDTADLITSLLGKQVVLPYALPGASWSYASPAAVTDTTDDVAQAAGGAGVRHYITGVQVFNGHDTVGTEVVIKDGTTVLWRGWAEQTGGGCSAKFDPPLRGTANTAVNVANITTGSSTYFNLQGYSAAE